MNSRGDQVSIENCYSIHSEINRILGGHFTSSDQLPFGGTALENYRDAVGLLDGGQLSLLGLAIAQSNVDCR